jgi:hypothetical protein
MSTPAPEPAPSAAPVSHVSVVNHAPASRPPPAPVPVLVQAIDRIGEIAFVAFLFVLTLRGKCDVTVFVGASMVTLGIQTGIRNAAQAKAGASHVSGALGLAFAVAGSAALHRILAGGSLLGVLALSLAGC